MRQKNSSLFVVLLFIALMFLTTPVYAETYAPTNSTTIDSESNNTNLETSQTQNHTENTASNDNTVENRPGSGVQPVSPSALTGKVENLVDKAHEAGKPIMVRISQVMMAVVAFMLIVSIFIGGKMLRKSFAVMFCVSLGLFLYINASTITGMIVWLSDFMGR